MQRIVCLTLALLTLSWRGHAQRVDFVATAEINQASLNASFYQQNGRFYADVSVKNVSKLPQKVTIWTNPSWSWATDTKDVATSQEAMQNIPVVGTLQPGEIYRTKLEMVTDPKGKRPITFRLGFLPNTQRPVRDSRDSALIWSNQVTLAQVASLVGALQ